VIDLIVDGKTWVSLPIDSVRFTDGQVRFMTTAETPKFYKPRPTGVDKFTLECQAAFIGDDGLVVGTWTTTLNMNGWPATGDDVVLNYMALDLLGNEVTCVPAD
jgi:hypothetical protein